MALERRERERSRWEREKSRKGVERKILLYYMEDLNVINLAREIRGK